LLCIAAGHGVRQEMARLEFAIARNVAWRRVIGSLNVAIAWLGCR
jgi:hypothetical protein